MNVLHLIAKLGRQKGKRYSPAMQRELSALRRAAGQADLPKHPPSSRRVERGACPCQPNRTRGRLPVVRGDVCTRCNRRRPRRARS